MIRILAIETSTDVCSVAFQNVEGEIFEKRIQGRSVHSEYLFLYAKDLMKEHGFSLQEIETVLVSNGPGSYTGLRIAASAVKGMFFGSNANLYSVNTLAGFAEAAGDGVIHSVIDARRTHVYHQKFEKKRTLEARSEITIKEIQELESELKNGEVLIGTGIQRFSEDSLQKLKTMDSEAISAANLIQLFNRQLDSEFFQKTTLEALDPNYITSSQVNNSGV